MIIKPFFSSGRRLSAPMAASLATAACCVALNSAPAHAQASADSGTLTVAMRYVVPAFVGGSKVRTPEALDTDLAEALAATLNKALHVIPRSIDEGKTVAIINTEASANNGKYATLPADSLTLPLKARAALISLPDGAVPPASFQAIPTGYVSRPMAIMRSDTDIKSWEQLKGRTVCLSEGGLYVGRIAAQYSAIEKVFKAPADALLALRTGGCDAAVHDDAILHELLKLPEWKKFSAKLSPATSATLAFVAPASDTEMIAALKDLTSGWRTSQHLATLKKKRVQDIAFEVYLEQVIPDCH